MTNSEHAPNTLRARRWPVIRLAVMNDCLGERIVTGRTLLKSVLRLRDHAMGRDISDTFSHGNGTHGAGPQFQ